MPPDAPASRDENEKRGALQATPNADVRAAVSAHSAGPEEGTPWRYSIRATSGNKAP